MAPAAIEGSATRSWATRREGKQRRMAQVEPWMKGKVLPASRIVQALEMLLAPGDKVVIESIQKQADFLSRSLAQVDAKKLHDLHIIIAAIARPDHLALFEQGIAKKVDFSFAGPQSLRVAQMVEDGQMEVGAIHTYVELSARMFVDLIPNAVLVCAEAADGGIALRVEDSGSGIPHEHVSRIFERFYRADPSRSRDEGGTGLGLAIVKHLVEAHGGRVSAESERGRGTAIVCWFPGGGRSGGQPVSRSG